jgi:NAD(P)-dependent dehydrogenase (short-subunit alcohol dehydrogenase family)
VARTAVVTGAAKGIGQSYACRLARDGMRVVLADLDSCAETEAAIAAENGVALSVGCDVSEPESVSALREAAAEFGDVDVLVHNAGIYPIQSFEEITFEQWRRLMSVNLDSVFLLSQAFVPGMRARGWGRVICVSSGMFHLGAPGGVHYVASKGGIIGFVRSLAAELGSDGVTVNAIAPGLIRSHGTSRGQHDALGVFDHVKSLQAIDRTGTPEDLTGFLSLLASDEAGFITGQTLLVDGGAARA